MFGNAKDQITRERLREEAYQRLQEHYDGLCKTYPHEDDPRRDTDFWHRTDSSITNRLLSAILTELQRANDRAADNSSGL